jgi:UDP-glucose 4-epimerase
MRCVVTGGAGFIGANLVRHLVGQGHDVVVLDDLSTGAAHHLDRLRGLDAPDVELVVGSVVDAAAVQRVVAGADAVVHLAAVPSVARSLTDPLTSHAANATGTLTVLEAVRAAGNPHVVVASSSSVYGDTPELPKHEEMRPRPRSPYAVSKLATESYALAYQACFGTPVLALRFFNVYGPLQAADHAYAAVIPRLLAAALADRVFRVDGDGRQTRDFTHVSSVCEAIGRVVAEGVVSPDPVNLAFGTSTSLLELVDVAGRVLGRPVEVEHGPPRPGDVRDSQAATDRLAALVPGVRAVELEAGLESVVRWMRSLDHA